jgi:hypothetical protein
MASETPRTSRAEPGGSTTAPTSVKTNRLNKLLIYAGVLLLAFLAGFLPQRVQVSGLSGQVKALTQQTKVGAARQHLALAFVEVTNNNYGVAGQHASAFFDQLRQASETATDANEGKVLQSILAQRDETTGALAKADPAVRGRLQDLLMTMESTFKQRP